MGPIPDQFPISLRAWSSKDDKATELTSLIGRINAERGNFRNVTEDTLEQEIREQEAGVETGKEEEQPGEDEVDEEEPDRLKELAIAREEILGQLEQAHNASLVALDFISLLLSKDTPVQAGLSISPALRDAVPLGTLGSDKLSEPRASVLQRDENRRIAKGWKIQSLNDSMNLLLDSATRLEKEIESETKYWEQILTVSENGWAMCRMPQEKHTLGVRFGFAESAPAFRNRSLAPLRRNPEGTISLGEGIASKRLRVRIQTNGMITGELAPPNTASDSASLEGLILNARNTIFEEELWQELNREARLLASHGVRHTRDEIICPITATKRLIVDLVPNEEEAVIGTKQADDEMAELIAISLKLLLSHAHRQNLNRRSQRPPPINLRPPSNPPYYILRAIIIFLNHHTVLRTLTTVLDPISSALVSTGLVSEKFSVETIPLKMQGNNANAVPEQVIDSLVFNMSAKFAIPITSSNPLQALDIALRTNTDPRSALEAHFHITATGPLAISCKPPPSSTSTNEVKSYILWAVACALAEAFAHKDEESSDEDSGKSWSKTHDPTVLRKAVNEERDHMELAFRAVINDDADAEIRVLWRHQSPEAEENMTTKRFVWNSKNTGTTENLRNIVDRLVKETGDLPVPGEHLPPKMQAGWSTVQH